jgi:hypothetical protein
MSKVISKDKVKKGKHIWKGYTSLSQELRVGLIWIKRDQGPKSCSDHHTSLFMKPQIHMPQVLKVFTMPTMPFVFFCHVAHCGTKLHKGSNTATKRSGGPLSVKN